MIASVIQSSCIYRVCDITMYLLGIQASRPLALGKHLPDVALEGRRAAVPPGIYLAGDNLHVHRTGFPRLLCAGGGAVGL